MRSYCCMSEWRSYVYRSTLRREFLIMLVNCNICGCSEFVPGHGGRSSSNGEPPQCQKCKSLERHRAMRRFFERLVPYMGKMRCLQFSWDPSLNPTWFRKFDDSYYGGKNSIDISNIDLPSSSYDFVFLSHIIEFIEYDRRAFKELIRIISPSGILVVCFASPQLRETTIEHPGFSGPTECRRQYGKDRSEYFGCAALALEHFEVRVSDPVTGMLEVIDVFTRSSEMRHAIISSVYQTSSPFQHLINIG